MEDFFKFSALLKKFELYKTFDENLAWQPAENMSMLSLQYVLMFLSLVAVKKNPTREPKLKLSWKTKQKDRRTHGREKVNLTNSKLGLVLKSKVRGGNEF